MRIRDWVLREPDLRFRWAPGIRVELEVSLRQSLVEVRSGRPELWRPMERLPGQWRLAGQGRDLQGNKVERSLDPRSGLLVGERGCWLRTDLKREVYHSPGTQLLPTQEST